MRDFDQDAGRRFAERPDNEHTFGEGFQMTKTHFDFFTVDNLLGQPRDRNTGTNCRHDDNVAIGATLKIFNVPVVGQDFRPEFEVGGRFKDFRARRIHND